MLAVGHDSFLRPLQRVDANERDGEDVRTPLRGGNLRERSVQLRRVGGLWNGNRHVFRCLLGVNGDTRNDVLAHLAQPPHSRHLIDTYKYKLPVFSCAPVMAADQSPQLRRVPTQADAVSITASVNILVKVSTSSETKAEAWTRGQRMPLRGFSACTPNRRIERTLVRALAWFKDKAA
ncbi:hypothetical protein GN958_ATG14717 [Phytophthora infestans]|uniref:Uncharacterized protein n=1 Tax=Phytophthora infestans TaxID=4787 RepID=A0A8S9U586_PHYIN|nr:hypothetical protein GN958_ATG14717 [Phytophthora infestans]